VPKIGWRALAEGGQQKHFPTGGVYLKKSETILLTGSVGGSAKDREPSFCPRLPKIGSGKPAP